MNINFSQFGMFKSLSSYYRNTDLHCHNIFKHKILSIINQLLDICFIQRKKEMFQTLFPVLPPSVRDIWSSQEWTASLWRMFRRLFTKFHKDLSFGGSRSSFFFLPEKIGLLPGRLGVFWPQPLAPEDIGHYLTWAKCSKRQIFIWV